MPRSRSTRWNRLPGKPRVPPIPMYSVLADRDDGTEWAISFATADATLYISINDELPTGSHSTEAYRYPAGDGIDMGQGIRLFVRGGRLGYEMVEYNVFESQIFARDGVQQEIHQIVVPSTWRYFPDHLGWILENPLD